MIQAALWCGHGTLTGHGAGAIDSLAATRRPGAGWR